MVIADVSHERLDGAANELEGAGIRCQAAICDITDRASVAQLVETATELGPVASVIHTAGLSTVNVNEGFFPVVAEGRDRQRRLRGGTHDARTSGGHTAIHICAA